VYSQHNNFGGFAFFCAIISKPVTRIFWTFNVWLCPHNSCSTRVSLQYTFRELCPNMWTHGRTDIHVYRDAFSQCCAERSEEEFRGVLWYGEMVSIEFASLMIYGPIYLWYSQATANVLKWLLTISRRALLQKAVAARYSVNSPLLMAFGCSLLCSEPFSDPCTEQMNSVYAILSNFFNISL
jgi:hypothetical protein